MHLPATSAIARLLGLALRFTPGHVPAQLRSRAISGIDVQKLANGVLGIMSYTVAPDVTTSSLAISNATKTSTDLTMSQVGGGAKVESVSLWARRRVPTGWGTVWDRPVRYVYEVAHTRFLGNETDVGLTHMSSVGFGLELDSSARDIWVMCWRAIARYKFGPGLSGWALGRAVSF